MCGICGIVVLGDGPPVEPGVIRRMTDAMAHRGPDGEGIWLSEDGRVALGHRRLSIVDLSPAGAQPMTDPEVATVITYNGEVYNFAALRDGLIARGHGFRSRTDTEAVLHLYREDGPGLLDSIEGDFAFGLWDEREQALLLARDRAGVKPLYYAVVDGRLLFASEVRALLATGLVAPDINETALYHYLTYLVSPPGTTLIRGVQKLEIGSALRLDRATGAIRKWRYWEPLPGRLDLKAETLDEEFEALFRSSVRKRLMSDVPVGVLFSGGVDSSLNAAVFKEELGGAEVRTFTVGMPNTRNDESSRAKAMAHRLGTTHHEVMIDDRTVLDAIDTLAYAQDEPVSDPVSLPLYFVSRLARESGTIVLQAGEGADETFCGYRKYLKFLRVAERYWNPLTRLPSFVPGLLSRGAGMGAALHPGAGKAQDVLRRMGRGQEFFMSSAVAYFDDEKPAILGRDFRARTAGYDSYDVVEPYYRRLDEAAPDATFLQRLTFLELNLRLPELLLMRVDKMSMAHGLEVRVPFLDHRLVDFAMSVPDGYKLRSGIPKEPVKRLAARYAGREDIYRPKQGFGAPLLEWFGGRLAGSFNDLIHDPASDADEFFNRAALGRALKQLKTPNQAFQIWVVYNFLAWRRSIRAVAAA